jgi:hypothetical protein
MGEIGIVIAVIFWLISIIIFIAIIRHAIDSSQTSKKLDHLADEIRMLRRELKDQGKIIDKRV